jgi:hypothetical protein
MCTNFCGDGRLTLLEMHFFLLQVPPLLGAGHHTIHHLTYKHNYG